MDALHEFDRTADDTAIDRREATRFVSASQWDDALAGAGEEPDWLGDAAASTPAATTPPIAPGATPSQWRDAL